MARQFILGATALGLSLLSPHMAQAQQPSTTLEAADQRCTALRNWKATYANNVRIDSAQFNPAGPAVLRPNPMEPHAGPPPLLPAHCQVTGTIRERTGIDGQAYAIRFHVRLPVDWNQRFLMQGGGGSNGELGDALGGKAAGAPALPRGYAVLSQDSGHDNAVNGTVERGGPTSFGLDPQARADYGNQSLPLAVTAAKELIAAFYGNNPKRSYFAGCSKGGQEGMMLAQRYPDLFDGIIAAAPGMSLPKAAVAEAWDTQSFAMAAAKPLTPSSLAASFSDADLSIVSRSVLSVCDSDDGLIDGMVGNIRSCTRQKVEHVLRQSVCTGDKQPSCLSSTQVDALIRVHDGVRNSKGEALYASFPWDAGWSDRGWRVWKIGSVDGRIPAINVLMGAPSLAMVFTTPPSRPTPGLQGALDYAMGFDFDRDAPKIFATSAAFTRSAWTDIGARSADIDTFTRRGGKLIIPHGVSDPVFSINDTIGWWEEVNTRTDGRAAATVRVFPVPGMTHCSGGPSTDLFDSLAALEEWVERGKAPDHLIGTAGPMTPWPGRQRPICAYPSVARYSGNGDIEKASSFKCAPS